MSALLIGLWLATGGGAGVTLFELAVEGDAAAVAPVLAKRLAAHGARGELVVGDKRLWLVAEEAPVRVAGALTAGRLRFAPVADGPGPDTTALTEPGPPPKTWHVQLNAGMDPVLTEVKAARGRQFGMPQVSATFDAAGKAAFHALTKRLVGKKLAIVIDQAVMSVPVVREAIPGGRVMITLGASGDLAEAERLAAQLRAGPLPAPVKLLREAVGTRTDADGTSTVRELSLRYPTPKRWHPAACALSQRDDCRVLVVPATP